MLWFFLIKRFFLLNILLCVGRSYKMKLYLAHVGFYDSEIGIYELHSNLFTVAHDVQTAKQQIKRKKVFIDKKMHIDGIQEISFIDGYELILEKKNAEDKKTISFDYDEVRML